MFRLVAAMDLCASFATIRKFYFRSMITLFLVVSVVLFFTGSSFLLTFLLFGVVLYLFLKISKVCVKVYLYSVFLRLCFDKNDGRCPRCQRRIRRQSENPVQSPSRKNFNQSIKRDVHKNFQTTVKIKKFKASNLQSHIQALLSVLQRIIVYLNFCFIGYFILLQYIIYLINAVDFNLKIPEVLNWTNYTIIHCRQSQKCN